MPATSPIPEEVAKCHTAAGEYGRYVITTGPYMIDGSDKLDISSCGAQKPISGFNPNTGLNLVRNPNYDPATDSPDSRQATCRTGSRSRSTPTWTTSSTRSSAVSSRARSRRPRTRSCAATSPAPTSASRLRVNAGDRIWYAYMNLTHPALRRHPRAQGDEPRDGPRGHPARLGRPGRWAGPATHVLPRSLVGGATDDYDPYQQPVAGDVEAAKAEMKQSKYDTDQDGICDAGRLQGRDQPQPQLRALVVDVPDHRAVRRRRSASRSRPARRRATAVDDDLARPHRRRPPFSSGNGWGKDFADPITYFGSLFDWLVTILQSGNQNFSLVGLTAQKAKQVGVGHTPRAACPAWTPTSRSAPR